MESGTLGADRDHNPCQLSIRCRKTSGCNCLFVPHTSYALAKTFVCNLRESKPIKRHQQQTPIVDVVNHIPTKTHRRQAIPLISVKLFFGGFR